MKNKEGEKEGKERIMKMNKNEQKITKKVLKKELEIKNKEI